MNTPVELGGYEALAPYYDEVYNAGLDNRALEINVVRSLLNIKRPEASSVLDLGCGTGSVLKELSVDIDRLVGIDASEAMLENAQLKGVDAELMLGDMTDFNIAEKFDAVLCLFNAINHLPTLEQWEKTFECTSKHLKPGGIFIMDTMTKYYMDTLAADPELTCWSYPGGEYQLTINSLGVNSYETQYSIRTDLENGSLRFLRGSLRQTVFPLKCVLGALSDYLEPEVGFDLIPELKRDGKLVPVSDKSVRPLFVCTKPY